MTQSPGWICAEDLGPCAFFDVAAAGAAAEGVVVDVDFGCVEHGDDLVAPAPGAAFAVAGAGADDGVADEEEGGVLGGGLHWLGLWGVGDCRRLRERDGREESALRAAAEIFGVRYSLSGSSCLRVPRERPIWLDQ